MDESKKPDLLKFRIPITEAEWNTIDDSYEMLERFPAPWDGRKLKLFGCACLYRVWHLVEDPLSRQIIEATERFADGNSHERDSALTIIERLNNNENGLRDRLNQSQEVLENLTWYVDPAAVNYVAVHAAYSLGFEVANSVAKPISKSEFEEVRMKTQRSEKAAQADLLRDIFGNPFQHVEFDKRWRTPEVISQANSMYGESNFEKMPALADTLESAGCNLVTVLKHCRNQNAHVRGCWVLDLILEKEQPLALTPIESLTEWLKKILRSDLPVHSIEEELSCRDLSCDDVTALNVTLERIRKHPDGCQERRIVEVLDWISRNCPHPGRNEI